MKLPKGFKPRRSSGIVDRAHGGEAEADRLMRQASRHPDPAQRAQLMRMAERSMELSVDASLPGDREKRAGRLSRIRAAIGKDPSSAEFRVAAFSSHQLEAQGSRDLDKARAAEKAGDTARAAKYHERAREYLEAAIAHPDTGSMRRRMMEDEVRRSPVSSASNNEAAVKASAQKFHAKFQGEGDFEDISNPHALRAWALAHGEAIDRAKAEGNEERAKHHERMKQIMTREADVLDAKREQRHAEARSAALTSESARMSEHRAGLKHLEDARELQKQGRYAEAAMKHEEASKALHAAGEKDHAALAKKQGDRLKKKPDSPRSVASVQKRADTHSMVARAHQNAGYFKDAAREHANAAKIHESVLARKDATPDEIARSKKGHEESMAGRQRAKEHHAARVGREKMRAAEDLQEKKARESGAKHPATKAAKPQGQVLTGKKGGRYMVTATGRKIYLGKNK